jgi:hypothetical protein
MRERDRRIGWIATCLLLAACGSGGDPASVVRGFVEAGKGGDREKALEYLVQDERKLSNVLVQESPELDYRLGRIRRDGDHRIVPVTISEAGDRLELDMVLVREEGAWRISIERTLALKRDTLLREVRKGRQEIDRAVPRDE